MESTFIYYNNERSDRRCEGWFIKGVAVCRQSSFLWGIIKREYGQIWEMENAVEAKGQRVSVNKTKACSYYLKEKQCFESGCLCLLWCAS